MSKTITKALEFFWTFTRLNSEFLINFSTRKSKMGCGIVRKYLNWLTCYFGEN